MLSKCRTTISTKARNGVGGINGSILLKVLTHYIKRYNII